MKIRWLILFFVILMITSGCSILNQLLRNFNDFEQSLYYVHDSNIIYEKLNIAVITDSITFEDSLKYRASVTCNKSFVLPLFLWEYDYTCELGKKNFSEDLSSFIHNSFIQESYRAGKYLANPDSLENSVFNKIYSISINVKDLSVKGPYHYSGTSSAYHYSSIEVAGPAMAKCTINLILKQNNDVILEKSIYSEQKTEFLKVTRERSSYDLRERYSVAMTEAFSEVLKDCIVQIVSAINSYIDDNENNPEIIQVISLDDIFERNESNDIEERQNEIHHNHVIVVTNDYNEFEGKIVKINSRYLSLDFHNTLIIIKKKNIQKILDSDQNDITQRELSKSDFKKINYNSYYNIKEIK